MFNRGCSFAAKPGGLGSLRPDEESEDPFSSAGGNPALAQTLDLAHHNLMNSPSPGQYPEPSFHRVGIGIDGGFYGLMISQEFRN